MTQLKTMAELVLLAEDNTILLLRRSDDDTRRPGQWDVAGGHVDAGETVTAAAVRETKEEAGIEIEQSALTLLYSISKPWDSSLSCTWLFFGAHVKKTDPVLSHEHIDFAWVSLENAIDMIEYDLQKNALQYIADNHLLD